MKKLIEMRAGLLVILNGLLEAAKTEERAFTEDEEKKFNETEAEIKRLDATIEAEKRAQGISELKIPEEAPKGEQLTKEQLEERAFTDFINGKITEMRSGEQNVTMANNAERSATYAEYSTAQSTWKAALEREAAVLFGDKAARDAYVSGYLNNPEAYQDDTNSKGKLIKESEALINARDTASAANNKNREAHRDYLDAMSYMDKLDEASTAYYEGRYGDLKDILYAVKDTDKEMLESGEGTFDELNTAYQNLLGKSLSDLDLALDSGRQKEIDSVLEAMEETYKLGKQAGTDTSDIFSDEFIKGVQEMVDKGFDISKLAAWAKDSGIDVGDIFGDEYIEIVQKQLDHDPPFDINDLLIWGMNSGIDVGKVFEGRFREIYQNSLNGGFDISTLIDWAIENSERVGDVFGYGFQTAVTKYIYDTNDLIYNNINSAADAALYKSGDYQIGYAHGRYQKNATGNFLNIGHEGIIAEAGPELIQVMNGGVKVTPLTRNARNTPVSEQAGSQKIIYENINIYATVSNDYDVRLLGERLAAEKKSVEESKGL